MSCVKRSSYNRYFLTETRCLIVSNIDSVNTVISLLKEFGCKLALDDFGTGVSTYSYLKRINVDMVKIDGEFIQDIMSNEINQEIVKSIVHIARLMGIKITAELANSSDCCEFLQRIGVDYLQGNYLGRPIPGDEFLSAAVSESRLEEVSE